LNLPNGWAALPFKSAVIKASVVNENKIKQRDYFRDGLLPIIDQGTDFIGGYSDDERKAVVCTLPAIVFGDHTKIVKYVNQRFCAGADGIRVIIPPAYFSPKCLYYFMGLLAIKLPDKGYARHYQYLEKEMLLIPPLAEQCRIVAKTDALFSELDKGVETLQTIRQQLRMYRQAVLKWPFEGKLTEMKPLSTLVKTVFDGPFGSNLKTSDYKNSGVRVVRLENIKPMYFYDEKKSFVSEEKYAQLQRNTVMYPDLIIATFVIGEIRACIIPKNIEKAINKADCVCIRTNDELHSKFIMYYLSTKDVYSRYFAQVHGDRPRVNTTQIKQILIPKMAESEQEKIVAAIESRLSVCDKLEQIVDENLNKAQALKQSILKKAFSGQLAPQDPSDEPAEKLLERIKAERAASAKAIPARKRGKAQ
jgi:type I restriction enzyme S subunit